MTGLRSLVVLKHPDEPPLARDESTGRLEIDGLRLPGKLVDGREQPGSSCLTWRPLASETASALEPGVSGRIIYKEPPPPAPPRTTVQQNRDDDGAVRRTAPPRNRRRGPATWS